MGLTRQEFFAQTGMVQIVEPLLKEAYEEDAIADWERSQRTSFYVSSFPGDNIRACGRKAIYEFLGVPGEVPSRFLQAVSDAGKDIEDRVIDKLDRRGVLLSDGSGGTQLSFKIQEYWLSGKVDGLLLPYGSNRPHILEVKTKSQDKIDEMKNLVRSYDDAHRVQALTYIGLAHVSKMPIFQEAWVNSKTWRVHKSVLDAHLDDDAQLIKLQPCRSGSILYISRDDPSQTVEYYFNYDPEFMKQGLEKLTEWKSIFGKGKIPDRPRREDGKYSGWSELPCKWCDFKRDVCKPDWTNEVENIEDSAAIEYTKQFKPDYSHEEAIETVIDRWKNES